jgi:hypothetical protein
MGKKRVQNNVSKINQPLRRRMELWPDSDSPQDFYVKLGHPTIAALNHDKPARPSIRPWGLWTTMCGRVTIPYVSSKVVLFSTSFFALTSYPSTWGSGNKHAPTLPSDCIPCLNLKPPCYFFSYLLAATHSLSYHKWRVTRACRVYTEAAPYCQNLLILLRIEDKL